ncbi:MAG: hypothetical protein ACETWQ_03160 [Phycisphaerae bacterium]
MRLELNLAEKGSQKIPKFEKLLNKWFVFKPTQYLRRHIFLARISHMLLEVVDFDCEFLELIHPRVFRYLVDCLAGAAMRDV